MFAAVVSVLVLLYIGPCNFRLTRCFWGNSIYLVRTLFHYLLAALAISPILFFINDKIFKSWLYLAFCWIVLMFTFIPLISEYSGGWGPRYNLERESFSIWMAKAFVIISLALIIWQSVKGKRGKKI